MKRGSSISRRDALVAAGGVAVAASTGGCEKLISRFTAEAGQTLPDSISPPSGPTIDPFHHLLNRAAHGQWPGDIEEVRKMGQAAWIDQQLDPESIQDDLCDLRSRRFEELEQPAGECFEYDKPVLRRDMARHTLLRAVYSKRQLFEVMVGFWTDHLNINIEKGNCIYLKPADDREVVRKHALGKFRDLIRASATSPAMLVYLDGNENRRATTRTTVASCSNCIHWALTAAIRNTMFSRPRVVSPAGMCAPAFAKGLSFSIHQRTTGRPSRCWANGFNTRTQPRISNN